MLCPQSRTTAYVFYGRVTKSHIESVYPGIDPIYQQRLSTVSSEVQGVSLLTLAYWRIASGKGGKSVNLIPTEADCAPDEMVQAQDSFIFGGPGVNRLTKVMLKELGEVFRDKIDILPDIVEHGRARWRLYLNGDPYPKDQDELLQDNVDLGIIIRTPNPHNDKNLLWIAAGIRAFGTEAAIKALVTPSLIKDIDGKVPIGERSQAYFAILSAPFDKRSARLSENIQIHTVRRLETLGLSSGRSTR